MLLAFARENQVQLAVVGPDNPLALGIVDLFQKNGLRIWGPNQKAAQFEASKAFAQVFMQRHRIPTARAGIFSDARAAKDFAAVLAGHCAVKADGLALGKGVMLAGSLAAAEKAIDAILIGKAFGKAGSLVVIQEYLAGTEISLHALCDGRTAKLFPTSQDHKRAFDGDRGPNTGGMGAYSPAPFLSGDQLAEVGEQILDPWLRGCASEGIDFRGIVYPGIMLTKDGPRVLEFNARFGDPEAQVYLTRLENDLVELLEASVDGGLDKVELKWNPMTSVCVVMAGSDYPSASSKGKPITGLEDVAGFPNQ
jgi:phosphoribosylamine--glycine ligase